MQYRRIVKKGREVSVLGYGCLRFPMKNGKVDVERTKSQMLRAYENGVNYFDTAYIYHKGKSESILGAFIKEQGIREQVMIADKLPAFLVNKSDQIEKYFYKQLQRLQTHYIDYYLMHMLDSLHSWEKLKDLGILAFINEKKASGEISHIGFSFHGQPDAFIEILEDYPWDFCQIQYNYLDEYNQAGVAGLKRACELGIGVVIMEPLRGGNLAAKAPKKVLALFKQYPVKRTPATWSLRWLWDQAEVGCILSGMNEESHIDENCKTASETLVGCMTPDERQLIESVKKTYDALMKVPCTSCNYCMPCPYGVDIPSTFSDYNDRYFFNGRKAKMNYIGRVTGMVSGVKSGADRCVACGKCERHCPQNIAIIDELKNAHKALDRPILRQFIKVGMFFLGTKERKK